MSFTHYRIGVPKGIRTPVTAVKGQCPRPLDDGDTKNPYRIINPALSRQYESTLMTSTGALAQYFHQTICVSTSLNTHLFW